MRCFISLNIPERFKIHLTNIQGLIKGKFIGKLTSPENIHLTLKFLGELDEITAGDAINRLHSVTHPPFVAAIKEIGVFHEKKVRIIWAHLTGAENLQKQIDQVVSKVKRKERRFMSHITIARVKEHDKHLLRAITDINKNKETITAMVDSFSFMRSTLTPKGPVYEELKRYLL